MAKLLWLTSTHIHLRSVCLSRPIKRFDSWLIGQETDPTRRRKENAEKRASFELSVSVNHLPMRNTTRVMV